MNMDDTKQLRLSRTCPHLWVGQEGVQVMIGDKSYITGLYVNDGCCQVAIVASITEDIDWRAYIGATHQVPSGAETVRYVLERGCKLSEEHARHFFPGVKLPYAI